jgi:hypothetical protein
MYRWSAVDALTLKRRLGNAGPYNNKDGRFRAFCATVSICSRQQVFENTQEKIFR